MGTVNIAYAGPTIVSKAPLPCIQTQRIKILTFQWQSDTGWQSVTNATSRSINKGQ